MFVTCGLLVTSAAVILISTGVLVTSTSISIGVLDGATWTIVVLTRELVVFSGIAVTSEILVISSGVSVTLSGVLVASFGVGKGSKVGRYSTQTHAGVSI